MSDNQLAEDSHASQRDLGQTLARESVATLSGAAKQPIGVAGSLKGLYFHSITFGNLWGQVNGDKLAIYLAPVALLLITSSPTCSFSCPIDT